MTRPDPAKAAKAHQDTISSPIAPRTEMAPRERRSVHGSTAVAAVGGIASKVVQMTLRYPLSSPCPLSGSSNYYRNHTNAPKEKDAPSIANSNDDWLYWRR